jgi:hypothetical protein
MTATAPAVIPALADIAPLVGRQFALADAAGNRFPVTLDQATAMPVCEYPGRTREPFQIQFRSAEHSVRAFLPQGTYAVEGLADEGIFLVPIGPPKDGAGGFLYQAIFS